MDLTKQVLWKDLYSEQQQRRDLEYFKKYDAKFIKNIIESLNQYINSLFTKANIQTKYQQITSNYKISKLIELTLLQRAVLYHTATVIRFRNIISMIYNNSITNTKPFTSSNPSTIFNHLPKILLAKEFITKKIPRYGEFLAELQINHPDTYRACTLIIEQSRYELALNIFYVLRDLLPEILSSKGISQEFNLLLKNMLKKSYQETEHFSKHKNIFLFIKQAVKDTSLNMVFDLIQALNLNEFVAGKFAEFITKRTDSINPRYFELHVVELVDIKKISNISISSNNFYELISKIKNNRIDELKILVDQLIEKVMNNRQNNESAEIIKKIKLLTPFNSTTRVPLKDQSSPNTKLLFTQDNVIPLLEKLKINIHPSELSKSENIKILVKLKNHLSYSKQNASEEVCQILNKLERKIFLAEQYTTNTDLINAINNLSSTISINTQKNFLGQKYFNENGKLANNQRKELLYLLRDRAEITLSKNPVPTIDKWDTFLINELKGPLYTQAKWQNCFFSFTSFASNQRFPGLLADQLFAIDYINNFMSCIMSIINNHKETLPIIDSTDISLDQIAGTSHLQALYKKLTIKQKQLNSYVLYLEFKSIQSTLEKYKWPNFQLHQIKQYLIQVIDNIKNQATKNDYHVTPPPSSQILKIIHSLKSWSLIKVKSNEIQNIIESLTRLNDFYYGDSEKRQASINFTNRKEIDVHQLSLIKRLILALINFSDYQIKHGLIKSLTDLFTTSENNQTKKYFSKSPNDNLCTISNLSKSKCNIKVQYSKLCCTRYQNINVARNLPCCSSVSEINRQIRFK